MTTINKTVMAVLSVLMLLLTIGAASATVSITNVNFDPDTIFGLYNKGTVTMTIKNTGTTVESGLVELAFFPNTASFVSTQTVCDPNFPYNVHKTYTLAAGEQVNVQLTATNIPQGTYKVVFTHSSGCCTDGTQYFSCTAKTPYGFESILAIQSYGDPMANNLDQCNTDSEALTYVKAHGQPTCIVGDCINPSLASSVAQCTTFGNCVDGAQQSTNCNNGTTVTIRTCTNGNWVDTGLTCGNGQTNPPPPSGPIKQYGTYFLVAALAGIGGWFLLKKK